MTKLLIGSRMVLKYVKNILYEKNRKNNVWNISLIFLSKIFSEDLTERIPIICEKCDKKNISVPTLDKTKYLVPFDLTVGQFMFVLRKRMKLSPEQAIFLFVDGIIPSSNALVQDLYHDQVLECVVGGRSHALINRWFDAYSEL